LTKSFKRVIIPGSLKKVTAGRICFEKYFKLSSSLYLKRKRDKEVRDRRAHAVGYKHQHRAVATVVALQTKAARFYGGEEREMEACKKCGTPAVWVPRWQVIDSPVEIPVGSAVTYMVTETRPNGTVYTTPCSSKQEVNATLRSVGSENGTKVRVTISCDGGEPQEIRHMVAAHGGYEAKCYHEEDKGEWHWETCVGCGQPYASDSSCECGY
jgi:hypothetical protein